MSVTQPTDEELHEANCIFAVTTECPMFEGQCRIACVCFNGASGYQSGGDWSISSAHCGNLMLNRYELESVLNEFAEHLANRLGR